MSLQQIRRDIDELYRRDIADSPVAVDLERVEDWSRSSSRAASPAVEGMIGAAGSHPGRSLPSAGQSASLLRPARSNARNGTARCGSSAAGSAPGAWHAAFSSPPGQRAGQLQLSGPPGVICR